MSSEVRVCGVGDEEISYVVVKLSRLLRLSSQIINLSILHERERDGQLNYLSK